MFRIQWTESRCDHEEAYYEEYILAQRCQNVVELTGGAELGLDFYCDF